MFYHLKYFCKIPIIKAIFGRFNFFCPVTRVRIKGGANLLLLLRNSDSQRKFWSFENNPFGFFLATRILYLQHPLNLEYNRG